VNAISVSCSGSYRYHRHTTSSGSLAPQQTFTMHRTASRYVNGCVYVVDVEIEAGAPIGVVVALGDL
jgi:hypothetical protein